MKNSVPPAPPALSAQTRKWWRRILSEFELDLPALLLLEQALLCFDRILEARAAIEKDGAVVRDRFGQVKTHPATLLERDNRGLMLRYFQAIGLNLEPLADSPGRGAEK